MSPTPDPPGAALLVGQVLSVSTSPADTLNAHDTKLGTPEEIVKGGHVLPNAGRRLQKGDRMKGVWGIVPRSGAIHTRSPQRIQRPCILAYCTTGQRTSLRCAGREGKEN